MEIFHLPIWKNITKLTFTNEWDNKIIDHIMSNKTYLQNLQYLIWHADDEYFTKDTSLRLAQLHGYAETVKEDGYVTQNLDKEKFKSFHGWCVDLAALHEKEKAHQLQELCLFDPRSKLILDEDEFLAKQCGNLYSGFKNLKRLNIGFSDIITYKPIIIDLFTSNIDTLEYIGINCPWKIRVGGQESQYVLTTLMECINKTHKSNFKIRITGNEIGDCLISDIITLSDILSKQTENFMIILNINHIYKELNDKLINNKLLVKTDIDDNGYCYISNKECLICGYNENWSMKCQNCE